MCIWYASLSLAGNIKQRSWSSLGTTAARWSLWGNEWCEHFLGRAAQAPAGILPLGTITDALSREWHLHWPGFLSFLEDRVQHSPATSFLPLARSMKPSASIKRKKKILWVCKRFISKCFYSLSMWFFKAAGQICGSLRWNFLCTNKLVRKMHDANHCLGMFNMVQNLCFRKPKLSLL